jgi:hypothetical protein
MPDQAGRLDRGVHEAFVAIAVRLSEGIREQKGAIVYGDGGAARFDRPVGESAGTDALARTRGLPTELGATLPTSVLSEQRTPAAYREGRLKMRIGIECAMLYNGLVLDDDGSGKE